MALLPLRTNFKGPAPKESKLILDKSFKLKEGLNLSFSNLNSRRS
jgi:hypothetical protein